MQHIFYKAEERGCQEKIGVSCHSNFSFAQTGNPGKIGFGLLRVFNCYHLKPGYGTGFKGQQNMEVICVVLEGLLHHHNTIGYDETLGMNDVMVTSSGSGLGFEKENSGDEDTVFLELWIEPKLQNFPPLHSCRRILNERKEYGLTLMVSNEEGDAHCWINQNCKISLGNYEAGDHLQYNFEPYNKCIFLYVISGELHVEDHHLHEKDAVGLWGNNKASILMLKESCFILVEVPVNH